MHNNELFEICGMSQAVAIIKIQIRYVYVLVPVYVCMYACIYMNAHVYMYVYIYMGTYREGKGMTIYLMKSICTKLEYVSL